MTATERGMTQTTPRDEAVLYARYEPEWGRMMLCNRDQFGAVEYRRAPAPASGEVDAVTTCNPPLQVAIKPLEWRGSSSDSPVGEYVARKDFASGDDAPWDLELDGLPIGETYPSLREAKAAAQADFDRRIRSALTPAAQRWRLTMLAYRTFRLDAPRRIA